MTVVDMQQLLWNVNIPSAPSTTAMKGSATFPVVATSADTLLVLQRMTESTASPTGKEGSAERSDYGQDHEYDNRGSESGYGGYGGYSGYSGYSGGGRGRRNDRGGYGGGKLGDARPSAPQPA
ncbi:hypothetical protein M427DRAFT_39725 [Gonapodya prolifera JEL478]|uniref:Uncharacterized protein n=1 Tax=Gonapodya prolifera (strain JEL478) TaxID=1344416 RepID=A0A138ZWW2_GONPJ|nr:hypothetical protein M427DRAFT_39725 [Gonapodya prolifera JEL478]|eukprot:KXS09000.1 hypothetical protein M427DRAFT_39725 [Gonapodya prolifera JEL478]